MNKTIYCLALLFFLGTALSIADNEVTGHAVLNPSATFYIENFAPTVQADDFTGTAGDLVIITVAASDPNGDSLTITFAPPLNGSGQWQSSTDNVGTYYSIISVSDGNLQTNHTVTITLNSSSTESSEGSSGGGGGSGGGGSESSTILPTQSQIEICRVKWVCTEWGECTEGKQTRTCTDLNNCELALFKPDETKDCSVSCEENWECTEWGECVDSTKTRICNDKNLCDKENLKRSEMENCYNLLCHDNLKNQGEVDIDCGGPCKPCPIPKILGRAVDTLSKTKPDLVFSIILTIIVIIIFSLFYHEYLFSLIKKYKKR